MKLLSILLVEDNRGDVMLTREALADSKISNPLHVVSNGEEAIAFLMSTIDSAVEDLPGLILLDINLPRVDGKEVLAFIKEHPKLQTLPVVILTTSSSPSDRNETLQLQADMFITKPIEPHKLCDIVQSLPNISFCIIESSNNRYA